MKKRLFVFTLLVMFLAVGAGTAAAQSSQAMWAVKYWDNANQEGTPTYTTSDGKIDYSWGTGSPAPGIHPETWSGRWTSFINFEPGTYRFTITSDDGVLFYIGDKHVILDWNKRPVKTNVATLSLSGGRYPVALDYFDDVGEARLRLRWERIGPAQANSAYVTIVSSVTAPPVQAGNWTASYFNNTNLQGNPVVVRNETVIDYNWGNGAPVSGVNADNFSVRWTGILNLTPGRYRFTVTSDDGVRLWVADKLIIDRWSDRAVETFHAEVDLAGGATNVRLEYYEHGGKAQIDLDWVRLSAAPGTGGPSTAVVNTAYLNFRAGPGTNYHIIMVLPRGATVTLLGRNSAATWVYVMAADGQKGWMHASYLLLPGPVRDLPEVLG